MKIWIACYECGETHQVEEQEHYTSRQICAKCKADRAKLWEVIKPEITRFENELKGIIND